MIILDPLLLINPREAQRNHHTDFSLFLRLSNEESNPEPDTSSGPKIILLTS